MLGLGGSNDSLGMECSFWDSARRAAPSRQRGPVLVSLVAAHLFRNHSDGTTRHERMIKKGEKLRKLSEGFNFFLRLSFNAQRVQFQTSRLLKASGAVENYLTFAA